METWNPITDELELREQIRTTWFQTTSKVSQPDTETFSSGIQSPEVWFLGIVYHSKLV